MTQASVDERTVTVMVAEPEASMGDALRGDPGVRVVHSFVAADSLIDAMRSTRCDVALFDLRLSDASAGELSRRAQQVQPGVLVMTYALFGGARRDEGEPARQQRFQQEELETLGWATAAVLLSRAPRDQRRSPRGDDVESTFSLASLNDVDLELIRCLVRGETDMQIAARLFVSRRTVQNHLLRIRRIAGVRSRAQLVGWAVAQGLLH